MGSFVFSNASVGGSDGCRFGGGRICQREGKETLWVRWTGGARPPLWWALRVVAAGEDGSRCRRKPIGGSVVVSLSPAVEWLREGDAVAASVFAEEGNGCDEEKRRVWLGLYWGKCWGENEMPRNQTQRLRGPREKKVELRCRSFGRRRLRKTIQSRGGPVWLLSKEKKKSKKRGAPAAAFG